MERQGEEGMADMQTQDGRGQGDAHSCRVTTDEPRSSVMDPRDRGGGIRTETRLAFGSVWGSRVGGMFLWNIAPRNRNFACFYARANPSKSTLTPVYPSPSTAWGWTDTIGRAGNLP